MGEQDLKLYLYGAWGSPFSRRVEIALKLKGIPYEYIEEDIHIKSPELLKYNPVHKMIPVLVHNELVISESQVIIEYVDEVWDGPPLLPLDPSQRALARFWAKFIDDKCIPSLLKALWGTEDEQDKALEEANENLKILEREIGCNKFFGGEEIGFIDIVANFIGFWLGAIQEAAGMQILTKETHPLLCQWAEEFVHCSIIKENLPPRDRLVAFYKIQNEAAKASKQ